MADTQLLVMRGTVSTHRDETDQETARRIEQALLDERQLAIEHRIEDGVFVIRRSQCARRLAHKNRPHKPTRTRAGPGSHANPGGSMTYRIRLHEDR